MSAQYRPDSVDVEAIWREFHGRLLSFIARRVPDGDSAEDILQEVMLRVHRHGAELEHAPAVAAWVHQIARNAIADHYRKAQVRRERPSGVDLDRTEAPAAERDSPDVRSELAACLAPLLERLPPIHAEALTLTELAGVTQVDAAARLGLSTSTMKSRVQRARAQLRERLEACCEIGLDSRGDITAYSPRRGGCDCGAANPAEPPPMTAVPRARARSRPGAGGSE